MAYEVKKISLAMSLRVPQEEALSCLDKVASNCNFDLDTLDDVSKVASENCQNKKVSFNFNFPSFCFDMTTGIGKTRLMGASIYYLYKTKGYKHFFILTPGNTIYDKLRMEFLPHHPKYVFKGLEAVIGNPKVYDGENYELYKKFISSDDILSENREIEIFIFNIGKIFSNADRQFHFYRYQELLGSSFADILASFKDLVICMDESHRYYAPASMAAINLLKPILGLEFTATPKKYNNVIYSYGLNEGAGKFLKIPVVLGRTNMAGYSPEDVEQMKIIDGLTLHENRKLSLKRYCYDNNLPLVKPIVLIACKDTNHAQKIRELIDSDSFFEGKYRGKVMEVHSKLTGEESEENIQKLLSIESVDNKIEIVLHVYKLKEGWDVNNLYTIIPLNAAKSDILAIQTIGRGLRLPFGAITGDEEIDTLDIVAHDHYRELLDDIKNNNVFKTKNLDDDPTEPREQKFIQSLFDDEDLGVIESTLNNQQMVDLNTNEGIELLYQNYAKQFEPKKENKQPETVQRDIFNYEAVDSGETVSQASQENKIEVKTDTSNYKGQKQAMSKDDFVKKVTKLKNVLINTPSIRVTPTSTIKFEHFDVVKNIKDFDLSASKIERYDAINKELLSSVDAIALKDPNPFNTLAIALLDSMSELSSDEADFIVDVVQQYIKFINVSEDELQRIVRRYAKLIVDDLISQIRSHMVSDLQFNYKVEKNYITFKKYIKNIKNNGILDYKKPFEDKKNIRKYLFEGYKKSYYPVNSYDSNTERLFATIIEEDEAVLKWIRLPLNQLGIFWNPGQQYNPDFLVETEEAKFMIEVKAENEADDKEVLAKAHEAIKWCEFASQNDKDGKKWIYCLITDNNIKVGNTFKFTYGLSKKI